MTNFANVSQIFPPKLVYMAGPISGLSYEDAAVGWREELPTLMASHIHCVSPMRGKNHLEGLQEIGAKEEDYPFDPISTASAIVTRDHNDVFTCDAMVANFLDAPKASLGTAIEFGWAHAYKKPIIMIMEPKGNIHDHLMLTNIAGYHVGSVQSAAIILTHLLTPGV